MPLFRFHRYEIRSDARLEAERAMHELAAYVRAELPDSSWVAYRDRHAPHRYVAVSAAKDAAAEERQQRAPGTEAFLAALRPLLVDEAEPSAYELVTSSDLAPRHQPEPRPGAQRRRRR